MNKLIHDYMVRIGRKGGEVKSPAKAKAARRNGKRGGRPKRKET